MNHTSTTVGVAFLFTTFVLLSVTPVHADDSHASDKQCPIADNSKTVYQPGKPRTYTETRNGVKVQITNYYGQKCADTRASGFCVANTVCLGTTYKDLDGTQKPLNKTTGGSGGGASPNTTQTNSVSSTGGSVSTDSGAAGATETNQSGGVGDNQSGGGAAGSPTGSSEIHTALESALNPTSVASQNVSVTPVNADQALQQTIQNQNVDGQNHYVPEAQQQNTFQAATYPTNASIQPAQIVQMITSGNVSELGPSTSSFAPVQVDSNGNVLSAQQLVTNASTFGSEKGATTPTLRPWYSQIYNAAANSLSKVAGVTTNAFNQTLGVSSADAGTGNKLTQTWNFGNLDGGTKWDGSVSCTGRQACFTDAYSGARANFLNMSTQIARGNDTLSSLMKTLSPPTENSTSKMISYLSSQLNVAPSSKLDFANETQMVQLFNNVTYLEHSVHASDVMDAQVITSAYKSAYEYRVAHPK